MKIKIALIILVVIGLFFLLPQPESTVVSYKADKLTSSDDDVLDLNFIIRNVRVYDGDEAFEKMDVLIENQRVKLIEQQIENSAGYRELDATGKTLIPGLIDAHTHTWGEALSQALNFGVTTEMDMFTMPASSQPFQARRDALDNIAQADLYSATILATAPKGHGTEYGLKILVLESESQVEQFIVDRIADGADYIKAVYLSAQSERQLYPSISKAILAKLIESSHQHHKMLVVHVDNYISAKEAVELGADGLVHSFMDKVVDTNFVKLMQDNKAFIIPTLSIESSVAGINNGQILSQQAEIKTYLKIEQRQQLIAAFNHYGIPQSAYDNARQSVGLLSAAGVVVLAGTDAPNPGTAHGASLHQELALLVNAGLTPEQALHSATGAVRQVFPVGQRGTLKTGAAASMLLIEGNPLVDISATRNIIRIWKNGVQFKRHLAENELTGDRPLTASLISDFNHNEKDTVIGAGIIPTTDQFAGGQSQVSLSLVDKTSSAGDTALAVKGEVKTGFAFPWSGFAFVPGKSYRQGADLTVLKGISFEAKGVESFDELTIMVFQQGSFQPSFQKVELTHEWKNYQIPLASFQNVDFALITNISFVATTAPSHFEFQMDNLRFE